MKTSLAAKLPLLLSVIAMLLSAAALAPHLQNPSKYFSGIPAAMTASRDSFAAFDSTGRKLGSVARDGDGWLFTAANGKTFAVPAGDVTVQGNKAVVALQHSKEVAR